MEMYTLIDKKRENFLCLQHVMSPVQKKTKWKDRLGKKTYHTYMKIGTEIVVWLCCADAALTSGSPS